MVLFLFFVTHLFLSLFLPHCGPPNHLSLTLPPSFPPSLCLSLPLILSLSLSLSLSLYLSSCLRSLPLSLWMGVMTGHHITTGLIVFVSRLACLSHCLSV